MTLAKMTPMSEKITSCEMTRNAKYRATTARSSRVRVVAPWYLDSLRMAMGRKYPKTALMVGGSTADARLYVKGDALPHWAKKGI